MISDKFAMEQVARLAGLDMFPKGEKAALNELRLAIQVAETEAIAKATIDYIMGHSTSQNPRCPLPADVRRIANEGNEQWKAAKADARVIRRHSCALCHDTGVKESTYADDWHSIASWCVCERGRARLTPEYMEEFLKDGEDWVDCVNRNRRKLLVFYPKNKPVIKPSDKRTGAMQKVAQLADPLDYHGEF